MRRIPGFVLTVALSSCASASREPGPWADRSVVLQSDGWELHGDWRAPDFGRSVPAALLLHRAAGSRHEYDELADALARRGVASLRLDLRAAGESVNLGRFEEPYAENRYLIEDTHRDVSVALRFIKNQPSVDAARVAAVGASYTGEAIGESRRRSDEKTAAYVILSPGDFSEESIAEVDPSGVPWLFVRTAEESPVSLEFIDAVFEALEQNSETAELRVLPGSGHATRMFENHPELIEEIADWLSARLGL